MPNLELLTAYCRTHYRVDGSGHPFVIRIGDCCEPLDRLLAQHEAVEWAFVTACNPRSRILTGSENKVRQTELERRIAEFGFMSIQGTSASPDEDWPEESGLLIFGIGERDALRLASEFDQHAIICGCRSEVPRLRFTSPAEWTHAIQAGSRSLDRRTAAACEELICSQAAGSNQQ